jgi:hypothetical protein
MAAPPRPLSRPVRFFVMNLGTLVGIIVYFHLCGPAVPYPLAAVTHALRTALVVHTVYMAIARWLGEMKQFDVTLWLLLAFGTAASFLGATSILSVYQHYSPAFLFTAFGLTALLPLLFGREPFTVYYGVRQAPRWQHRTPAFMEISRVMAGFWAVVFFTAAALCFARPTDPMFTAVYANLVILGIGLSAGFWLPPLYMKLFPPALPDTAEPIIMGMPLAFDRAAAGDARAVIQFRVSGAEPGDYWLRVGDGRCESFEGVAPAADLTVHTPGHVWVGVVRGDVDGTQALTEERYRVEGDVALLLKLNEWFRVNGK